MREYKVTITSTKGTAAVSVMATDAHEADVKAREVMQDIGLIDMDNILKVVVGYA